jgi:hypothetical protein
MSSKEKHAYRKRFAQFTHKSKDIDLMDHCAFMDYSAFLLAQPDVRATEEANKAFTSAKNIHKVRGFKQFTEGVRSVLFTILAGALILLAIAAIGYYFYFENDQVKTKIDFELFFRAIATLCLILVFVALFWKMSETTKKIMSLM